MEKIKLLPIALFLLSLLAFSYPVTQVFAQGDIVCEEGQFDVSLTCDPTSGTCCNQCDPGAACVAGDPHTIPCCSVEGNNMSNGSQPQDAGECDPNPACVENCCPAEDPNVPPADVTLDPNIDPRSPAPRGNIRPNPYIDPRSPNPKRNKQDPLRPQKSGQIKPHFPIPRGKRLNPSSKPRNPGSTVITPKGGRINVDQGKRPIKPNMQGSMQNRSDASNRALDIGKNLSNSTLQGHNNKEVGALKGQWISCETIRSEILPKIEQIYYSFGSLFNKARDIARFCDKAPIGVPTTLECFDNEIAIGLDYRNLKDSLDTNMQEVRDIIDDRC